MMGALTRPHRRVLTELFSLKIHNQPSLTPQYVPPGSVFEFHAHAFWRLCLRGVDAFRHRRIVYFVVLERGTEPEMVGGCVERSRSRGLWVKPLRGFTTYSHVY